ncbi:MAG: 3'(2'),5'-bisphosphate nucleotidase CysQ family protein [Spirochaetota bacterium]
MDTCKLVEAAITAALQAGREILKVYSTEFSVEKKSDKSPITLADKNAHHTITEVLKHSFPDIPILSEEGKSIPYTHRREWSHFWLVDPLDGTKDFVKRNDEFTVNIALIKKHTPLLGIIYVPAMDELYFASEELGAYKKSAAASYFDKTESISSNHPCPSRTAGESSTELINTLIHASARLPLHRDINHISGSSQTPPPDRETGKLNNSPPGLSNGRRHENNKSIIRVVTSRSHLNQRTRKYISKLEEHCRVESFPSGSARKLCLVAEGTADIYPRFAPTMEWDTAAGHAIVKQAGGEIFSVGSGRPIEYNKKDLTNEGFVAAGRLPGPYTELMLRLGTR